MQKFSVWYAAVIIALGIGSAFWGLIGGAVTLLILNGRKR